MKAIIMYDTQFGNGKKLAEALKGHLSENWEIFIGDIKDNPPATVIEGQAPDLLILGGAIRAFQGAPASKKWLKELDKHLQQEKQTIPYATAFITHGLPTDKITGWVRRYKKKLLKAKQIDRVYPHVLTGRVQGQEGPFREGELEKSAEYIQKLVEWMK